MRNYWRKVKAINLKMINILGKRKISDKRSWILLKEIIEDNRRKRNNYGEEITWRRICLRWKCFWREIIGTKKNKNKKILREKGVYSGEEYIWGGIFFGSISRN